MKFALQSFRRQALSVNPWYCPERKGLKLSGDDWQEFEILRNFETLQPLFQRLDPRLRTVFLVLVLSVAVALSIRFLATSYWLFLGVR